jgi:hypothetical protein
VGEHDDIGAYINRLGATVGAPSVSVDEAEVVLDLAREVAHASERRFAPVAAYAVGLAAAGLEPAERVEIARRVIDAAKALEDA